MALEQQAVNGCVIKAYQDHAAILVELAGVLKLQNCEAAKHQILALLRQENQRFYLHLGQLTEIDSAGLGVLVGLHMTARKSKVDFHLLSPTVYQTRLLETTRLSSILSIYNGIQAEEITARLGRPELKIPLPAIAGA